MSRFRDTRLVSVKRILRGIKLAVALFFFFFLNTGYITTILKIARLMDLMGYAIIVVPVCGFPFPLTLQFSV